MKSRSFALCFATIGLLTSPSLSAQVEHFHPKGKAPSSHTIEVLREARQGLPFDDDRDFAEQARGFLAAPESKLILGEAGNVVWDMERYQFLATQDDFDSIHPSLLRQSRLNLHFGLYEVVEGVYQVRGFDLANITFIKGDTGWIVFDPLTAAETALAAKQLVDEHLGEFPVVAVVYSHSHGDHWGGVRAMSTELFLDFVGIRLDPARAQELEFTMNLKTPDVGEEFVVELSSGTLTALEGFQAKDPDFTITIDRADLEQVMMGRSRLFDLLESGVAKAEGDPAPLAELGTMLVTFEMGFEVLPGTAAAPVESDLNPFEVGALELAGE